MGGYDFETKRGDTGEGFYATLEYQKDGVWYPVDLTDSSVLFLMGGHKINAGIHDAKNGVVAVTFYKTNTAVSGFYDAEFEITYKDGITSTYPDNGYLKIYIYDDLGGRN